MSTVLNLVAISSNLSRFPDAYTAPTNAPMLVPEITSNSIPNLVNVFKTPI